MLAIEPSKIGENEERSPRQLERAVRKYHRLVPASPGGGSALGRRGRIAFLVWVVRVAKFHDASISQGEREDGSRERGVRVHVRGDAASRRIFVDGDLIKRDDFLNRLGYLSSFVLGPRVVVRILTREREVVRALLFSTFLLRRRALGVGDDRDERLEPFPNVHVEQFRNFLLGVVRRVSRVVIKLLPVMSHAAFRQQFPSALKKILFAVFARRSFFILLLLLLRIIITVVIRLDELSFFLSRDKVFNQKHAGDFVFLSQLSTAEGRERLLIIIIMLLLMLLLHYSSVFRE